MRAYLILQPGPAATLDVALAGGADALVVDLLRIIPRSGPRFPEKNDATSTDSKQAIVGIPANACLRAGTAEWMPLSERLRDRPAGARLVVRTGPVDGPAIEAELSVAMAWRPDAIMLPFAHGRDVAHLGARLAVHEAETGLPDEATRIIALVANAAGALQVAGLVGVSPRLAGIGWDAGALSAELQAQGQDEPGGWSGPLAHVRSLVRLAAAAAGVEAIEAAYPSDDHGFRVRLAAARRDGFGAVLATNPAQVARIRAS